MHEDQETLLTRRHLLATGAVVIAGVAVAPASASAKTYVAGLKATPMPRYARQGYRRARFAPHVGTPVELRGGAVVRGTLVAIEDVPNVKSLAGDEDAYTLRFRGPAAPRLSEGLVGIRSTRFGLVELYITQSAATAGGQDYVAVINRRVPRGARRAPRPQRG